MILSASAVVSLPNEPDWSSARARAIAFGRTSPERAAARTASSARRSSPDRLTVSGVLAFFGSGASRVDSDVVAAVGRTDSVVTAGTLPFDSSRGSTFMVTSLPGIRVSNPIPALVIGVTSATFNQKFGLQTRGGPAARLGPLAARPRAAQSADGRRSLDRKPLILQ